MTRIERTQANCSALLVMISKLKELLSDRVIEVVNNGQGINIRPKKEAEKTEFTLDTKPLEDTFLSFAHAPRPLLLEGDREAYIRNMSFACMYYIGESEKVGAYDLFALFHNIHFVDVPNEQYERALLEQLCGLFRVPLTAVEPFIECRSAEPLVLQPQQPKPFNQIFSVARRERVDNESTITFDSESVGHAESIDSLFSIKDLLYAHGIDVSAIAEHEWFGMQANETAVYDFVSKLGHRIQVTFRYTYLKVSITKQCAE